MSADAPAAKQRRVLSDRALLIIVGGLFLILLAAIVLNLVLTLSRTSASCSFYKDLSGLPVVVSPQTHKPSDVAMGIVAHSREAFRGQGCSGHLPPPSPSFVHWAPLFHLPPE
jgi:hypothetical protein